MTRARVAFAALAALLVAFVCLAIVSKRVRHGLDDTASVASWAVAVGTFGLALATYRLARGAADEVEAVRDEASQVAKQIELQREQMDDARRAFVFPSVPYGWALAEGEWSSRQKAVLPIKNGGPGLALNVQGRIVRWRGQGRSFAQVTLVGSSVAPGDGAEVRLSEVVPEGWAGWSGYLRYSDLLGDSWVTYFRFRPEPGLLAGEHSPPELIGATNDPALLDAAGISARWEWPDPDYGT